MKPILRKNLSFIILALLVTGCAAAEKPLPTETPIPPTATNAPTNTPAPTLTPSPLPTAANLPAEWNEIPIMPGATKFMEDMGDFQFTSSASPYEIISYYKQALEGDDWKLRTDMMTKVPGTALSYAKSGTFVFIRIVGSGSQNQVWLHMVKQ